MKQIVGSYRNGELRVVEVPAPGVGRGGLLVRNCASLVSAGTERAMLEFARKGLAGKAMARPDLLRLFWEKVSRDGLIAATKAALARLDEPFAPGYSCAGIVLEVGEGVEGFAPGDAVACGGIGHACHAEIVSVPVNLCAKVPSGLELESAAFVAVGAIALHAFRLSGAHIGERVAVVGTGLVGLLAVQIARQAGCHVAAFDLSQARLDLARELGAELAFSPEDTSAEQLLAAWPGGADAVLICAATRSDEPIRLAPKLARDKARVVVVGDIGLDVPRKDFYAKELELVVSRSYGPGRYDPEYEEAGRDYPFGYVRWTERRNFEEFLALLASGKVNAQKLITHRFPIDRGVEAYELLERHPEDALGVLLEYHVDAGVAPSRRIEMRSIRPRTARGTIRVSFIGAGAFARAVLLPEFSRLRTVQLRGIASASGLSAREAAERYGFAYCTSSAEEILKDPETDAVVIATRHATHAELCTKALRAGKAVFVEKPLALSREELEQVGSALAETGGYLAVGFNRRFSPMARELKAALQATPVLAMHYTVNAPPVPQGHWTLSPAEGGRVLGEVGHFIDLMTYLCSSKPASVSSYCQVQDEAAAVIRFENGSLGSILYTPRGEPSFSKERLEVFAGGAVFVLEDFRILTKVAGGRRRIRKAVQDKGHRAEIEAFVGGLVSGGRPPVPFDEIEAVTLASLAIPTSSSTGRAICIGSGEHTHG